MDNNIIYRISNNEKLDLNNLSLNELYKLHFDEEKYSAKILLSMPSFSKERYDFLYKSYELIKKIRSKINMLECKEEKFSEKDYLYRIFLYVLSHSNKKISTILEIGCGNGNFLKLLSKNKNLKIYGCDIYPEINLNCKNITIYKDTIVNSLQKFDDNSIDLIIGDNVCEHFFPDEVNLTYHLINKKLNKNGLAIFIIPNSYIGPSDISKKFKEMGEKAEGFHFMEQTYKKNIKMFKKYGLFTKYICIRKPYWGKLEKKPFIMHNFLNILDTIKIFFEKILANLRPDKRKHYFLLFGYNIYILRKSNDKRKIKLPFLRIVMIMIFM